MTYRTALFLAAGTAAFMSATPIMAGSYLPTFMPSLQFVEQNEVPTRASQSQLQSCTSLEKSAKIYPADCGTYSRAELAKLKADLDD